MTQVAITMKNNLKTLGSSAAQFHQVLPHLRKLILAASLLVAVFSPTTRMPAASSDGCGPSFIRFELHDQLAKQSLANALEATLIQSVLDAKLLTNYSILDMNGTIDWAMVNVVFGPARETDAVWTFPAERLDDGWHVHCPGSPDAMRVIARIPAAYNPLAGFDANDWRLTTPVFLGGTTTKAGPPPPPRATVQYRLPYANGTTVYITQDSATHGGPIDMVGQSSKTIVAAADGLIEDVVQSHNECCRSSVCNPCLNYIVIKHANNEYWG